MASDRQEQTYVGAIDQGTMGTRFLVFGESGEVQASAYERHEQIVPAPGRLEHDPREVWENTQSVIANGLDRGGIEPSQLAGLGVTNQRETTVLWERASGEPVHNAVVWSDRRNSDRFDDLRSEDVEWIRERTGLAADAFFSAPKLEWLLDGVSTSGRGDLRARARNGELCFGTVDSWLVYKLTGVHATDVSNASRTMLFDIHELAWDDELLAEFGVPRPMLPEVNPSSAVYGRTDEAGVFETELPVAGVIADQQAALLGQACFDPGDLKATYGTGTFALMNTGPEPIGSERGLLTTVGFQLGDGPVQYALEGAAPTTGGAIDWLDSVGLVDSPVEIESLASAAESSGGVSLVPAFDGLGTPYWEPRARGTIHGLTRGTDRGELVRATLEAVGYQTRQLIEAMAAETDWETEPIHVDGGVVKNDFFCQLQADLLQRELRRPAVDATTALGAAYAAGLCVGYWDSPEDLPEWELGAQFDPDGETDVIDREYERWLDAVEQCREWADR
ncbi:glycerol kinase GlpK [Halovenus sp. WSH3]|uniref:ATP:glycerol 3-phosphotransferase n=1 Tax=Halovenus carboxidivorans TaxID=2692199 RepID=A0A6B0T082_9EURY|nr:glycerol kinase GlpK [Halovenus carboxidivorans]MXR50637.1 glycerol kinase GlpK [Halovenus carboxidivorans]